MLVKYLKILLGANYHLQFVKGRQILSRPRGDPMAVSLKHLKFMLSKVFTFPRNHQFDKVDHKYSHWRHSENHLFQGTGSKLKENIGTYIWRKLGVLSFLTGAQLFRDNLFMTLGQSITTHHYIKIPF